MSLKPPPSCARRDAADCVLADAEFLRDFPLLHPGVAKASDGSNVSFGKLAAVPTFPSRNRSVLSGIFHIFRLTAPSKVLWIYAAAVAVAARVERVWAAFRWIAVRHLARHAMGKRLPIVVKNRVPIAHSGKWPFDTMIRPIGFYNAGQEWKNFSSAWRLARRAAVPFYSVVMLCAEAASEVRAIASIDRACSIVVGHVGTILSYVRGLGRQPRLTYPSPKPEAGQQEAAWSQ